VPKTHRNTNREQFWRDTLAAWRDSGQSIRAFCAAQGLSEATFYARRRELADKRQKGIPTTSPSSVPTFAAVHVVTDPRAEVVLPGGVVVRVPVGADPLVVARLIAALGSQPCSPSA
jgi:hypothetical protein